MTGACKDCLAELIGNPSRLKLRPAKYPGPRCATHWRVFRKTIRERAWAEHIHRTYGMTAEFYRELLASQGGRCAICQRATGAARRLAVDHDHKQAVLDGHAEDHGCPSCWRGLLCRQCNRNVLGHLRDDPAAFQRGIDYLHRPPAQTLRDSTGTRSAPSASDAATSRSASPGSSAAGAPDTGSSESRT